VAFRLLQAGEGEIIDLGKKQQGTRLYCSEGACWITIAGEYEDRILQVGEELTLSAKGRVLVVAMTDTHLQPQQEKELLPAVFFSHKKRVLHWS